MDNYGIIDGYRINTNTNHHVDITYTEEGQREVYEYAKKIMINNEFKTVVDIGCGSGFKLMKYLSEFKTIGYEVEPSLSFLKTTYPDNEWRNSGDIGKSFNSEDLPECDLVICSDVIEHIEDPDTLLNYIKSFNSQAIIISTPCREILCTSDKYKNLYGSTFNGPPLNQCHVREWTTQEFTVYLSEHFNVLETKNGVEQIECQFHLITNK